ncbi:MAG TPA: TRAP transporter small permease [Negativicutes bacterium]|nr:TRAP transporter small permease [Negativicutes bacterium]
MQALKQILKSVDRTLEGFAIICLLAMILIVTTQVFTRKLFNFVFFWSEEITLLLLAWFSYMGIAIGFREKLHMNMDMIENFVSKRVITIMDRIIDLSTFAFGLYLIIAGWDFTVLMNESTLPATKLPNSVLYVVMPITGVMTCAYAALQFFGYDIRRYTEVEEEIKQHDA